MKKIMILMLITIVLVACGRQLPDEDELVADVATSVAPAEDVVAVETDEATGEDDVAIATEEADEENADADASDEDDVDATEEAVVEDSSSDATEEADEADTEPTDAPAPTAPVDQVVTMVGLADVSNGEALFNAMNDSGFSCANCHNAASEDRLVGPGLLGVPQRAVTRVEGQLPQRYIYNSIMHPNEYIVESYTENLMPGVYETIYSQKEIYDIVGYVMTLEDPAQPSVEALLAELAPAPVSDAAAEGSEDTDDSSDDSTDDAADEETQPETDESSPTEDVEVVVQEVTATPVVIVVTATPVGEADTGTEPADDSEGTDDTANALPTPDPNATPDLVVTLSGLGFAAEGADLYTQALADGFACSDCHFADSTEMLIGQGMLDVAFRAAEAGQGAPERYLYESIVDPARHPILSESYSDLLTDTQIYALIAYLMELRSEE